MKNGISPKVGLWFNFAALILTGVAAGSLKLSGVPDSLVAVVQTWASNAAWIIGVANMVFGLYSSSDSGPLINKEDK